MRVVLYIERKAVDERLQVNFTQWCKMYYMLLYRWTSLLSWFCPTILCDIQQTKIAHRVNTEERFQLYQLTQWDHTSKLRIHFLNLKIDRNFLQEFRNLKCAILVEHSSNIILLGYCMELYSRQGHFINCLPFASATWCGPFLIVIVFSELE